MVDRKFKIGLVVNPVAGIGGPVGLKGSDGLFEEAIALGGESKVADRVSVCLQGLPMDHSVLMEPLCQG